MNQDLEQLREQLLSHTETQVQQLREQLLAHMETQGQQLREHLLAHIEMTREQLIAAIVDQGGSLHTQMQQMEERLSARMDLMETRLNRHGGSLIGGARWMSRMTDWSERIEKLIAGHDVRIQTIEKRELDQQ